MASLIRCPSCLRHVSGKDLNLETGLARCGACDAAFYADGASVRPTPAAESLARPRIEQPKAIEVESLGNELTIRRRWFSPIAFFLLFFTLFWNGILIAMGVGMMVGGLPVALLLVLSIHGTVGVAVAYFTLAMFLNRTTIHVRHQLTVTHGPVPWKSPDPLDTSDLVQLYVRERLKHGRRSSYLRYDLLARTADGSKVVLLKSLENEDHALFLEQVIEEHLAIDDQPVPGQHEG